MKALKLSLALIVTLGLSSVALADGGCNGCAQADPCCGHGLLSKLSLHRCNSCCEAPKPCPAPCDPCAGHKLTGMLSCIKLPSLHGCGGCAPKCERPKCEPCRPKCEPKCCAPKPCAPKCCAPKCHSFKMPQICLPKIRIEHCCPKPKCCKPACEPKPCDPCNSCGHFAKLKGLLHRDRCCEAPKCDPCGGCGHKFSLHGLLGKRCNPCDTPCEGATMAPASDAPAAQPVTPAPKPMGAGANSNGLLILTPAG